jgi:phosphohistidine swiveling domain-containing protein
MVTLYGTPRCKGVGIAEAILLSDDGGLDSVPMDILRRGLESLRRREREDDMPAVVVVCNSLDVGLQTRLPGLRIAAIAAESPENDIMDCDTPAVVGVQNLLQSVEPGNIVIVDGGRGTLYVDPDAETVIFYQSMEGHKKTRRLFLESPHLPAVTQDGTTVSVFGLVNDISEASTALTEGADGLVIEGSEGILNSDWAQLLDQLAGKSLVLLGVPNPDAIRDIVAGALPLQVTIAVPSARADSLVDLQESVEVVSGELAGEDVEPAGIAFAVSADASNPYEDGYMSVPTSRVLVDARVCEIANTQTALADCVTSALAAAVPVDAGASEESELVAQRVDATVLLASSIDSICYLVTAGVHSIAVPAGLIAAAKDLIRSIPIAE